MILTTEQELARLLVIAVHRLGGTLEVDHDTLNHLGNQQLVWNNREDIAHLTVTAKSGEILIATVVDDVVEVKL